MASTVRETKSFSLEKTVVREIEKTRGKQSASARVNQLLRYALALEKKASMHDEIAAFYQSQRSHDRRERKAFQKASLRSLARDGD